MKIIIAAVGRISSGRAKAESSVELFNSYTARTPYKISLIEVEEKKKLVGESLKNSEAGLLLAVIPKDSIKIVLDENGREFSSIEFAKKLENLSNQGRPIAFLIGGSDGHGEKVKKSADILLSFGKMTWPHAFVRPMLAEQIYRAHAILSGHPYHK